MAVDKLTKLFHLGIGGSRILTETIHSVSDCDERQKSPMLAQAGIGANTLDIFQFGKEPETVLRGNVEYLAHFDSRYG